MTKPTLEEIVYTHPFLNEIRDIALTYSTTPHYTDKNIAKIHQKIDTLRSDACKQKDQTLAKGVWCIEQIINAQQQYKLAMFLARNLRFYTAWCKLEIADIYLCKLGRHFTDTEDSFGINFLRTQIPKLQKIFPYKAFISPGFIVKQSKCSICGQEIKIRNRCGHKKFEIYDGVMCGRVITKYEMKEISIVDDPVQKYSVCFELESGSHNYGLIFYIATYSHDWHNWSMTTQKRKTINTAHVKQKRNEPCHCGSGIKYKKCCKKNEFIEYDHHEFNIQKIVGSPPREIITTLPAIDEPIESNNENISQLRNLLEKPIFL